MTAYILYHSLGKAVPVNLVFPSTQVDGWAVGADLRVGKYLTIFIRYIMIPIGWENRWGDFYSDEFNRFATKNEREQTR